MNWQLEATDQFERDAKRYAKKQRAEYLAVMENLEKYVIFPESASHPKLV
jgi:mRNA-degrading endonuclease YafQ of YafQ-DinJ toxin-antitoxin module